MDEDIKRMIVVILEKCRARTPGLFKCMRASDGPDPLTGVTSGRIPATQFELCLRSVGITAPKLVFNVLLEMVGEDQNGQVDYTKFLEDLEIEENQMVAEINNKKQQVQAFSIEKKRQENERRDQLYQQQHQGSIRGSPSTMKPSELSDQRVYVEVDGYTLGGRIPPTPVACSYFKPRHLKSGYSQQCLKNEAMYCLPGGPMGFELRDSSLQPPVESRCLESDLHHMRDKVLATKVARQRAARNNSGNDSAFFG